MTTNPCANHEQCDWHQRLICRGLRGNCFGCRWTQNSATDFDAPLIYFIFCLWVCHIFCLPPAQKIRQTPSNHYRCAMEVESLRDSGFTIEFRYNGWEF